jgi:hypothetical protein
MRASSLFRIFFILYCFEAGAFLIFAPWAPMWDGTFVQVPVFTLRSLCLAPLLRGAVSGFGMVHMVWATHDLDDLLLRRRSRAGPAV